MLEGGCFHPHAISTAFRSCTESKTYFAFALALRLKVLSTVVEARKTVMGMAMTDNHIQQQEILNALEGLRSRLLDLTGHNPLLNFSHTRSKRSIRIVDELPEAITDHLLSGRKMKFAPVALPDTPALAEWRAARNLDEKAKLDAKQWAEQLGINSDLEVPRETRHGAMGRHQDKVLQALYFPEDLEARLGTISRLYKTSVEETGVNMLHLIIGFLEWYEDDHSEKKHHAPLVTIPVNLEKGELQRKTRTYEFELSYSGEDCQENISLAARLKQDFDYQLPEIGEELNVETYLESVEQSVSQNFPRWKVKRYMTVGFLNFGKLLMHRDLDPARWPEDCRLEENELVSAVVAGSGQIGGREASGDYGADGSFHSEIRIDELPQIYEEYPIIDNADSSQHSALIDAMDGKNLVIEGPPGTGKSQTITNLIAAAMHSGKTVLFVSEKLAALEVVKQRLDEWGLGEFCLELHSHATQKSGVMESVKSRLNLRPVTAPQRFHEEIERHRKLVEQLDAHARRINAPWQESGFTVHEILVGKSRLGSELAEELQYVLVDGTDTSEWNRHALEQMRLEVKAFASLVKQLSDGLEGKRIDQAHPWRGLRVSLRSGVQQQEIIRLLRDWNYKLEVVGQAWGRFVQFFPECSSYADLQNIHKVSGELKSLPAGDQEVLWEVLPWGAQEGGAILRQLSVDWQAVLDLLGSFASETAIGDVLDMEVAAAIQAHQGVQEFGFSESVTLTEIMGLSEQASVTVTLAREVQELLNEYGHYAESELPAELSDQQLSLQALLQLYWFVKMAEPLKKDDFRFRSEDWLSREGLDELSGIAKRLSELQFARESLSQKYQFNGVPEPEALDILISELDDKPLFYRWTRPRYWDAKKQVVTFLMGGKPGFDPESIARDLEILTDHLRQVKDLEQSAHNVGMLNSELWDGIATDHARLEGLIEWHDWVLTYHTESTGGLYQKIELSALGRWLMECPLEDIGNLLRMRQAGFLEKCEVIVAFSQQVEVMKADGVEAVIGQTQPLLSHEGQYGYLDGLVVSLEAAAKISVQTGVHTGHSMKELGAELNILEESQSKLNQWLKIARKVNQDSLGGELAFDEEQIHDSVKRMGATAAMGEGVAALPESSAIRQALLSKPEWETFQWIQQWAPELEQALTNAQQSVQHFSELTHLDQSVWENECDTLPELMERNRQALERPNALPGYLDVVAGREALKQMGLERLVPLIEKNTYGVEDLEKAVRHTFFEGVAQIIFKSIPGLEAFNGIKHSQMQEEFRKLDRKLLGLTQNKVAAAVSRRRPAKGHRGARVSEHTEMELLKHEVNKQRSHIPIRQLLKRCGRALQAIKPCFMMGPRSVAQYLEPGGMTFDLLVIDEASQMKPADAIGATARVNQLVVVGDPKQLPPTSFFDRLNTDEDEEEQLAVTDSESILDAVAPIFTSRRLRWHYRSKHPDLIAFSNHSFYHGDLLLFPSPGTDNGDLGLIYHRVEDGCYQNQVNPNEAMAIAKRVEELLCENPEASVGVATMSAKQRDYVQGLIDNLAKENREFNRALSQNGRHYEDLFVKNLETVQGDERDIMLISCTYGPEQPGGRVFQRFGPINSAMGWRRLNVLFTRSKKLMEIFASMDSGDINITENSNRGVRAFRQFLNYAKTKIIEAGDMTGRPPDSDFEIGVANLLRDHGYECDYQVGVAGFYIDLGVKDPNRPGKYIMGVECDGARYHSAKSVRDRDRLRQEILVSLGWNIQRIWSTDWFQNPHNALKPILHELDDLRSRLF